MKKKNNIFNKENGNNILSKKKLKVKYYIGVISYLKQKNKNEREEK